METKRLVEELVMVMLELPKICRIVPVWIYLLLGEMVRDVESVWTWTKSRRWMISQMTVILSINFYYVINGRVISTTHNF